MLVATDQNGQLTVWEKPIPASDFAKHELVETSNNVPAGQGHLNSGQKVEKKMETVSKKKKTKSDFVSQEAEKVDDEDEEMEDIVSLKDLHEDEEDDDDVMYDNGSDLDDFVEYSEGEQHLVEKYVKRSKPVSRTKPITSVSTLSIAPVKYIQPNATEFTANHQKRYLCYNLVGIVSTSTSTTGENMVEIDFHDVSQGRNMHFKDTFGFHLASLGQDGCLFASAYKKDDDLPSTIFFKSFDSWSQSQEIKFSLESGEEALRKSSKLLSHRFSIDFIY
jgi:chromosome transmission fidelity protein 4